jgi:hypothetical protein
MAVQLEIIRGTTTSFTFAVKSQGQPADLADKTLVFVANDTVKIVKRTDDNQSGFVITDEPLGLASLTFSVAETRAMKATKFEFSVEVWEASGQVQTNVAEGKIFCRDVQNVDE